MANYFASAIVIGVLVLVAVTRHKWKVNKGLFLGPSQCTGNHNNVTANRGLYEIVQPDPIIPVDDSFDWRTQLPVSHRPFKSGPYFLTMGIRKASADDWIRIENTYLDRIEHRRQVIANHGHCTIIADAAAKEACQETYDKVVDYLTTKYPRYFHVSEKDSDYVVNEITGKSLPKSSHMFGDNMRDLLSILALQVEEDVLILLYDKETDKYHFRAGCFLQPSGIDPRLKAGLALADIHRPVPQYKERLERGMDNFFAKLAANQYVERVNWTIQAHSDLYSPTSNHAHDDEKDNTLEPLDPNCVNFRKCFLRCERQTLTRLPQSKCILFGIRTYLTSMVELKEEGKAKELLAAIEALPPVTGHYKYKTVWGPAVCAYLRGETEGVVD